MNYIAGGFLTFLSIEDIKKKALPVWMLLLGGIGCLIYGTKNFGVGAVLMGMLPGVFMITISKLLPQSLGIGDGILSVMYGMIYGWKRTSIWLMNSFLVAAVIGMIISCMCKKRRIELPFVPFLTAVHIGMYL